MKQLKDSVMMLALVLLCSAVIGGISAAFLKALSMVSLFRDQHIVCLFFIPAVGVATAFAYRRWGRGSNKGNNLIIESVEGEVRVPFRMSILTFFFTIMTHLSGGSAGREGTAVQIGGTLTNKAAELFRLEPSNKSILILSGASAGFGSVFGTPLAGAFFGLEFCYIGKLNYEAMLPCFLASFTADAAARLLGAVHVSHTITYLPPLHLRTLLVIVLSSCLFGLIGRMFSVTIHAIKSFYNKYFQNYLAAALAASLVVLALTLVLGGVKYAGLSTWMMDASFQGQAQIKDPIIKFLLTCFTLGAGFQGGEVTPLFDIGSSAGAVIGQLLNISPSLLAALGLIAVFGSAANVPITTIMLGIDLFGTEAMPYFIIAAVISYYAAGHNGIYGSQTVVIAKSKRLDHHIGLRLREIPKGCQGKQSSS